MVTDADGDLLQAIEGLFRDGAAGRLTDAQLVERFLARGDSAAFEALVMRHGPMVLDVCRGVLRGSHDAEDAFQATFLVLALRARTIRRRDSLASWLFGVARRVAARSKADAARRRRHERRVAAMSTAAGRDEEPADLDALHEEIGRMPARFREPVVLCYLEGMTHEAAAAQLRCPVGTVSVRLMRAKERLRRRLARRGLLVPAAGPAAGGVVPGRLVESTASLAIELMSGRAAAGVASATVAGLVEGMMRASRLKSIWAGLLGIGLVAFAAAAGQGLTSQAEPEPKKGPPDRPSLVKTRPGGAVVELLGVSPHPSGPGSWWSPDGRTLPEAPYARSSVRALGGHPNRQGLEFAALVKRSGQAAPDAAGDELVDWAFKDDPRVAQLYRELRVARYGKAVSERVARSLDGPSIADARRVARIEAKIDELRRQREPEIRRQLAPGFDIHRDVRWEIVPATFSATGTPFDRDGRVVPGLAMIFAVFPAGQATCTVRIGVLTGRWSTRAETTPDGLPQAGGDRSARLGPARESDGKCTITAHYRATPDEVRLVAIGLDGREHQPVSTSGQGAGEVRQLEAEFAVPLREVGRFLLQTCPHEWTEFPDVLLEPLGGGKDPGRLEESR